jgi:hypothetical protein
MQKIPKKYQNLTAIQRLRMLIDIAKRRIKPGTGSSYEFLQRRTAMNVWPDLRPMLKGIKWVVVGGVATRAYMPERSTKDLDILIRQQDSDEVMERLEVAGYTKVSRLAVPGFLFHSPDNVEVDVIFGDYPWLDEALSNPNRDEARYPILDLPYLVLMKMNSGRGRDFGDVTTMLGLASDEELKRVRKVIKKYAPDLKDDLESLIYLGKMEMKGFEEQSMD